MTVIEAPDTITCQDSLPDELCRRASSSCLNDRSPMTTTLSGVVHAREQDVVCALLIKRRLVVPYRGMATAEWVLQ